MRQTDLMRDERPPLPTWGSVGKWTFVAGSTVNAVSRIFDDDAGGAGWAFRDVVAGVAMMGLVVWAVAGAVWLTRRRQTT